LTSDALFHCLLDNPINIKDLKFPRWAKGNSLAQLINKGVQDSAVGLNNNTWIDFGEVYNVCLADGHNCLQGSTLSLWMKHANKEPDSGQSFLEFGEVPGIKLYQVNGSFEHLSVKVNK